MSYKHNDIVSKQRLRDALNEEESMGFKHNDIVTTYAMDKAIAEGGGGGETGTMWHVVVNSVAMADTLLNTEKVEGSGDDGVTLLAFPFVNGQPYYSYSQALDSGLTDLTVDYFISDSYSPDDGAVTIKIYYNAAYAINATGDIEVTHDEYDFICTITGDGTITITAA